MFNYNPLKESIILTGETQTGKTEYAIKLATMLANNNYNVIINDVHRKFTKIDPMAVKRNLYDIKGKGLEIIQPSEFTLSWFNDLCALVYSFENQIFIIDELHNVCSKQSTKSVKNLELFCRNCHNRHADKNPEFGSSYIAIFQRPAEVPNFVLGNSTHRFCCWFDLPSDIKFMEKWVGVDVNKFATGEIKIEDYKAIYKMKGYPSEVIDL